MWLGIVDRRILRCNNFDMFGRVVFLKLEERNMFVVCTLFFPCQFCKAADRKIVGSFFLQGQQDKKNATENRMELQQLIQLSVLQNPTKPFHQSRESFGEYKKK